MTSPKHQIEALLFSSGKAMNVANIAELTRMDAAQVRRALKALQKDYKEKDSAVMIENDGDVWKMSVTTEHLPLVKNIVADTELSRACMETLAVIAYRYPKVLQSDVIDIRGSGAYEHIKELEQLGFVRKESSGRSFALKLTEKFFEYFEIEGEKDIKQLFKSVKQPDKQKTLGDLPVVDVEQKEEKEGLGFDVVDVDPKAPEMVKPNPLPSTVHQEYLDDLDQRISKISRKNDDNETDPQLQRPQEPVEEPEEKDN